MTVRSTTFAHGNFAVTGGDGVELFTTPAGYTDVVKFLVFQRTPNSATSINIEAWGPDSQNYVPVANSSGLGGAITRIELFLPLKPGSKMRAIVVDGAAVTAKIIVCGARLFGVSPA